MKLSDMWEWLSVKVFRLKREVEHSGATEDWTPTTELPPARPLPAEEEMRERLEAERALIDSQPIPVFEQVWDNLVARGVLTGAGADVETDWEEWTKDDLTLERISKALRDEDTTDDLKVNV